MPKTQFKFAVISRKEADEELEKAAGAPRISKFDPLKQHILWLKQGEALRIEDMPYSDVGNLRGYINRNIEPPEKNIEIVVRATRIDNTGKRYRAFVLKERV